MTVYAVQRPRMRDRRSGEMVDKYDLSPAEEYGIIEPLLSPTAKPFNSAPIIEELYVKLEEFTDEDYIICIGNPILIALAVSIAGDINDGRVKLLQWHGLQQKYVSVETDLQFTPA